MTVRPKDAASLVLVRHDAGAPAVLLGRRAAGHRFAPDVFVFPGGRVDPGDHRVSVDLHDDVLLRTKQHMTPATARALAAAAIRETAEETGLTISSAGALRYLGRAITPYASPIRFHARFFMADAADARGDLAGSGELVDLGWFAIPEALRLPLVDITEFMLHEIGRRLTHPSTTTTPFYTYRSGRPIIRHE